MSLLTWIVVRYPLKTSKVMNKTSPRVFIYPTATQAMYAAASAVASELRDSIATRNRAVGVFDGALLPGVFFDALVAEAKIDWTQVIVFQAGEYLNTDQRAGGSLRHFLVEHLIMRVPIVEFHALRGEAANPLAVAANYEARLAAYAPDLAVLGLDHDGRIGLLPANNDDQDYATSAMIVEVNGRRGLTLTASALMNCPRLILVAIGEHLRPAVKTLMTNTTSLIHRHSSTRLFLDEEAAAKL